MAWTIEYEAAARKQLEKIDRKWQRRIADYLDSEIVSLVDPRLRGKPLSANYRGVWRYRVGDYRILCSIEDHRLVVLVVEIVHRSEAYR